VRSARESRHDSTRTPRTTEFISPDVSTWTSEHVVSWIHSLPHLSGNPGAEIAEILEHQGITGPVLLGLNDEEMRNLGIDRYGHRRALLLALKSLNGYAGQKSGAGSPRSTTASNSAPVTPPQPRSSFHEQQSPQYSAHSSCNPPSNHFSETESPEMGNSGPSYSEAAEQQLMMDQERYYQEQAYYQQVEQQHQQQQVEYVNVIHEQQPHMVAVEVEPHMVLAPEATLEHSVPYTSGLQYAQMVTPRHMTRTVNMVPQEQYCTTRMMVNPETMTPRSVMIQNHENNKQAMFTPRTMVVQNDGMFTPRSSMVETPRSVMVSGQQPLLRSVSRAGTCSTMVTPQMSPRTMSRSGSLSAMQQLTPRAVVRPLQAAQVHGASTKDYMLDCTMPTLSTSSSMRRIPNVHAVQCEDQLMNTVASVQAVPMDGGVPCLRREHSATSIGYARTTTETPRGFQPAPQSARGLLQDPPHRVLQYSARPVVRYPR